MIIRGDAGIGRRHSSRQQPRPEQPASTSWRSAASKASPTSRSPGSPISSTARRRHRRAVRIAAAALDGVRSGAGASNGFAVCAGVLTLVTNAAHDEPVLLLVDDAQWIDPASIDTMVFALHRIGSDPVVALVGLASARGGRVRSCTVRGARARRTRRRRWQRNCLVGVTPSRPKWRRPAWSVGGNPLALMELDRTLDAAQRDGRRPLDDPPPVGAALARLVGRRIVSLPANSRAALVLVALGAPFPAPLPELLNRLDLDLASARRARNRRASSTAGRSWSSRTLCSAAALDGVEPSQRRGTHRMPRSRSLRPATRIVPHGTSGSAADGPDIVAAAALEAAGARAIAPAARPPARLRRSHAARLTAAKPDRARRLFLAGRAAWMPARPIASQLLGEAVADADPPAPGRVRVHARDGDRMEHRHARRNRTLAR